MQPALEWPNPVSELCQQLEDRGIATWIQGEGLLAALRSQGTNDAIRVPQHSPTQSLLCSSDAETLLRVLPRAVVSASHARRVTQATRGGPVDLIPVGTGAIEACLADFGLAPLAFAYRPITREWCDPFEARASLEGGWLACAPPDANPFLLAPRRYWIAARLLSEQALRPTPELLAMARDALPRCLDRLPEAAPARRELSRILESIAPESGLAWLRESGVSGALFPGIDPRGEAIVARLAPRPALRWAVWLHGSAIQRALVRLRMPLALAKDIERIQRAHPLDRSLESMREAGLRRILQRLDADEIDGLLNWRRLELAAAGETSETRLPGERLTAIEARIAQLRAQKARTGLVQRLAIDGQGVMQALGSGPGPHVGRALAHLARFIEARPEANEREALAHEVRAWSGNQGDGRA